jgi:iron(II)-dependent oxidoreductase
VSSPALLNELRLARGLVTALAEPLDDDSYRRQFHPQLSPLGWHLGHCTYIESYWLQEVIQQDARFTEPVRRLYVAGETPKPARGELLPPLQAQLQWVQALQSLNDELLTQQPVTLREHELLQEDYLLHFLIQHYNQHYETMLMALTQRAMAVDQGDFSVSRPFPARQLQPDNIDIAAGHYRIGGKAPAACDNELPQQQATLGPFSIARRPVSNSEFLAFMQEGGYNRKDLWSTAGWQWLQENPVACPDHWHRDAAGNWYGTGVRGAYELDGDDALHGISQHEAQAFANWADAGLPHEYQWEVACRLQQLEQAGRAWEWCRNTFHPYAGFRAFPYAGYSQPWFDNGHYTLRGGSLHTRPSIRRPSFRNFYQPGMRHIFAGLRLVY